MKSRKYKHMWNVQKMYIEKYVRFWCFNLYLETMPCITSSIDLLIDLMKSSWCRWIIFIKENMIPLICTYIHTYIDICARVHTHTHTHTHGEVFLLDSVLPTNAHLKKSHENYVNVMCHTDDKQEVMKINKSNESEVFWRTLFENIS